MKLQQPGILGVVNRNIHIMEPYSDIVDDVLVNLCENIRSIGDPFFSQQENNEVDHKLIETFPNVLQSDDPAQDAVLLQDEYQGQSAGLIVIPDELNFKIRMVKQKQRDVFNIVHNWSKQSVKNLSSISQSADGPLYFFVMGNAGCG